MLEFLKMEKMPSLLLRGRVVVTREVTWKERMKKKITKAIAYVLKVYILNDSRR